MNAPTESPAYRRIGWLALVCLCAVFAAWVAMVSQRLPERVATHFGAHGQPNGWMPRAQYRNFTLGIGIGTPLFVLGTFALIERLRGWGMNIPHKDYWLAPERRAATFDFFARQGFWFAALLVIFHGSIFYEVVAANARTPVILANSHFLIITGVFLLLLGAWATGMILRFRRPAS